MMLVAYGDNTIQRFVINHAAILRIQIHAIGTVREGLNTVGQYIFFRVIHFINEAIDLLPWCQQQQMPVMAYSPLAQAGRLRNGLLKNAVVNEIAHAHNISAAQVLLAWVISHQGVMAIPKAATITHVQQNAAVLEVELSSAELAMLDKAYPAPKGKTALDMV